MITTGFSEINDKRLNYHEETPWFCEISLTGNCNFSCKYCNRFICETTIENLESFFNTLNGKVKYIQLTGGEPTLHKDFYEILSLCKRNSLKIGVSSNGSFGVENYSLCDVDMFSFSLDDYDQDILISRGYKNPQKVIDCIREISKNYYVNVGLYVDKLNQDRVERIIDFILNLGVADIKISTSYDLRLKFDKTYEKYPILNYRTNNFNSGLTMRGTPTKKCYLVENDVTIVGDSHYPCLVYFREHGKAIGKIKKDMMIDRKFWMDNHDCQTDSICRKWCMDFKCSFNKAKENLEEIHNGNK